MKSNQVPILDELIEDFKHPNPNINKEAILKMIKFWPKEAIAIFIDNLDHSDIEIRRKSVKALGEFGELAYSPIANYFISSTNNIIRTSCLKVLVNVASKTSFSSIPDEIMNVIRLSLMDDSVEITLTLISLLRQLGRSSIKILFDLCKDKNLLKSKAAITAISEIKDNEVKLFLIDLLKDKDIDIMIQKDAINALKEY